MGFLIDHTANCYAFTQDAKLREATVRLAIFASGRLRHLIKMVEA